MKLQELIEQWKIDSKIDIDLSKESARIYDLHSKYLDLWQLERMRLKVLKLESDKLKLEKHEYFIQGPSKESPKNWKYPASGVILRNDLDLYKNADEQLQKNSLEIEACQVKVDVLKTIIDSINQRGFILGNMIKHEMWRGGSN